MRRWFPFLVLCCLVNACEVERGFVARDSGNILHAVQGQLATREAKLSRYRFAVRVEQLGNPLVAFDFTYRAPGFMRARLFRPESRVLSFDGQALYEVTTARRVFRKLRLPEAPAQRAFRVSERFAPYIPEGFRTPALPWKSVQAVAVTHPRAAAAVALRAQIKDDAGKPLTVTYTLRWPSGDFLVKRLEGSDGVAEVRVDEEQCDKKLGLCLPLRLSLLKEGKRVGGTDLLELELFEAPPPEDFTLRAPNGYVTETADL